MPQITHQPQPPARPLIHDPVLHQQIDLMYRASLDPESWLRECPGLHIEGTSALGGRALGPREVRAALDDLLAEGHCELPGVLGAADAARMCRAQEHLVSHGWPAVFAFVYDEFWQATARLGAFFGAALGADYRQLPDFWAWYVPPSDEARGWGPHRDRPGSLRADGTPSTLTAWLALSEATAQNGCIYLVPAGRDPLLHTATAQDLAKAELQNVRALPVQPGTALIWHQQVYHWGGRSSRRATGPRVNFACEFQRGDIAPCNQPLIDPRQPPDFISRLRLIGKQVRQYQHMYPLTPGWAEFADRLRAL